MESLSAYARQFLSMMDKPDVDHIEGLSPAISIEQKTASHNPRSTVGHGHRDLRLPAPALCPGGHPPVPGPRPGPAAQTVSQMVDQALSLPEGTRARPAGPGRAGPEGRAHPAAGRSPQPGLRPRPDRRRDLRTRRPAQAGSAPQAHHRGRGRPLQGAGRHQAAAGRVLRNRPEAGRRRGRVAPMEAQRQGGAGQPSAGAEMLFSDRFACPICSFSICRTRTAPLLLQQPGRRLRDLRRPRREAVLRPGPGGPLPGPEPGGRRHPRLGPAQRLLLLHDPEPREALRLRHRTALDASCRRRSRRCCCTAATRRRSSSTT